MPREVQRPEPLGCVLSARIGVTSFRLCCVAPDTPRFCGHKLQSTHRINPFGFKRLSTVAHLLFLFVQALRSRNMKPADGIANLQAKAAWVLATVLTMTRLSAALQTPIPAAPSPKAPEFAKATVRWVLVSIPDRKLA